ncbi:MAG: TonB-dependent receptor [Bryobacterales bacterium]|nr:TonB-dependent receptor [Bryobacterales bacterium]
MFSVRIILLAVAAAATLPAQTAQITGRVTDSTGAIIAGAQVRVTNTETGVRRDIATGQGGYYAAPLLVRGTYTVSVQQAGFKEASQKNITLDEGGSVRADFALEVGAVTESIEVSGQAPLLETERPTVSTVIPNQKVLDLPTVGRNPLQFALLVPGVRAVGLFGDIAVSAFDGSRASIGGGNPSGNNYMVDGIAAENWTSGGLQTPLSVDATEEFRLVVRNPSAEYGRSGGGIINLISRSGTNEYHGSGYWFIRNKAFNANDYFSNLAGRSRAPFNLNQYGATFGGPIRKDKTFFFFNWEKVMLRQVSRTFRSVPTTVQRTGDLSQTLDGQGRVVAIYDPLTTRPNPANPALRIRDPFPGSLIPGNRVSPVARAVSGFYPLPNTAGARFTNANNFFGEGSAPTDKDVAGLRLDHYLSPTRRIAGRYTWDRAARVVPNFYGNVAETNTSDIVFNRLSSFVNYSDSLGANLLLDLRAGLNRYSPIRPTRSLGFDISQLGFTSRLASQMQIALFPRFAIGDMDPIGADQGDQLIQASNAYSYVGTLTWIRGAHTIKMGSENRVYQSNNTQGGPVLQFGTSRGFTQGPDPNQVAANSGFGYASFLLGYPNGGTLGRYPTSAYTAKNWSLFIQDDWKLTPKLTVNVGLRWELEPGFTDRFNAISNFDPSASFTINGVAMRGGLVFPGADGLSRRNRNTSYTDFMPRLGFAYQVWPKTVVRGGYGISFLPATGVFVTFPRTGFQNNTPLVASVDGGFTPFETFANPFPGGALAPTGSSLGLRTNLGQGADGGLRTLKRGYSQQWSLSVQRELPQNWIVEAGYMGNRGVSMPTPRAFDFLPDVQRQQGTRLQELVDNPYASFITVGTLAQPRVTRATLVDTLPQFAGGSGLDSWADSIYHAATLRVEKRFSQGLSAIVSYTFSKLIDNSLGNGVNQFFDGGSNGVQNWENLRAERSVSTSDLPQRLVVSASYQLPFARGAKGWLAQVAKGWQLNSILSLQSGNVIAVTAPAPAFGGGRPNVTGDPSLASPTIDRWLNRDAFSIIPAFTFGNAPRNLPRTRTDGLQQLDFSLLKDFPVPFREGMRLQFRAEFFNLTNTPTFGNPGANIVAGDFGQVRSLATNTQPRQGQLALKLYF